MTTTPDTSAWLTPKEVAATLRYRSAATVCALIGRGELRAINRSAGPRPSYLIDPASVEGFIRRRMVGKPEPTPPPAQTVLPPGVKRFI